MELSLLLSNISVAREVDTPFMAWIQPWTMSGDYAHTNETHAASDHSVKASLPEQHPNSSELDGCLKTNLFCQISSVSTYSASLALHFVESQSLCYWERRGVKKNPCRDQSKEMFPRLPQPSALLPFFSVYTTPSYLRKPHPHTLESYGS